MTGVVVVNVNDQLIINDAIGVPRFVPEKLWRGITGNIAIGLYLVNIEDRSWRQIILCQKYRVGSPFTPNSRAILGTDFPTMPMWSYKRATCWSDRVTDVKVTPFGWIDMTSVKVK